MSTHAYIGVVDPVDGTVKSIYCHSDGYPDYMLPILKGSYDTFEKANELVDLGDISYLDVKVAPDEGQDHSFEHPAKDVTVAYHRDRGENFSVVHPVTFKSIEWFVGERCDTYCYIFNKGVWTVIDA